MVGEIPPQEAKLDPEDYLWPLTTIRDTFLNPGSTLPSPKLRSILTYHLERLKTPWRRAKSGSKDGPNVLAAPHISPVPGVQIPVDDEARGLAAKLAEEAGISGTEACLITKSCLLYSPDGAVADLERVLAWYIAECLALAQIVLAVLHRSREDKEDEWTGLANDVREGMMPDAAEYMENLFKGWASLAQRPLANAQRGSRALLWSTFQLRLQVILLEILFLILYQTPDRPAAISQGLIRGCIMSTFGTAQSNREFWDTDHQAIQLSTQIRDLSLLIALESFCLALILTPSEDDIPATSLPRSKDDIISLHLFLTDQSVYLSPSAPSDLETGSPDWPIPLVCLAWAIVLHSLPPRLQPPNAGYTGEVHQEMASRALQPNSAMFPWMQEILGGSVFRVGGVGQGETYRRKTFKDLLIGLSEMMSLDRIPDREALYDVWNTVFGSGSPASSLPLSADFWVADFPSASRRALLDQATFPHFPALLPGLLASLSGIMSYDAHQAEIFDVRPIKLAAEYFSNLPSITTPVESSWCEVMDRDDEGRMVVEASRDLLLPGRCLIPAGSRGSIIGQNGARQIVRWDLQTIGWGIHLEILRVAAGIRGIEDKLDGEIISVRELNIQGGTSDVLASGLEWLNCVMRQISGIGKEVLSLMAPSPGTAALALLELALAVLQQYSSVETPTSLDTAAAISALDLIASISLNYPQIASDALRTMGFFGSPGKRKGLATSLVQLDSSRGVHDVTMGVLRLVDALVSISLNQLSPISILIAGLHHLFTDVWSTCGGWRYTDPARRYELATRVSRIFEKVLAHPLGTDGDMTTSAQALMDIFVASASAITYRPLLEVLVQAGAASQSAKANYRENEAMHAEEAFNASAALLSTLLRSAKNIGTPATSLPAQIFSTGISLDAVHLPVVDAMLTLVVADTPLSNRIATLRLLRTYLLSTGTDRHRPSLVGLLHEPSQTFSALTRLAEEGSPADQQAAVWNLLAAIISTQPGCAHFVAGTSSTSSAPMEEAVKQISSRDDLIDTPHVQASLLGFLQAVLQCSSAPSIAPALRQKDEVWKALYAMAIAPIATPPTFALSLHAPDFASRIIAYAFATQARANATTVLAAELELLQAEEDEEIKSPALDAVLGLFRNGDRLGEAIEAVSKNGCLPDLHVGEAKRLAGLGVFLPRWKVTRLGGEREFGLQYLYAGEPQTDTATNQSLVNFSIDTLNLNWSILDADMQLTSSFRALVDIASNWLEDDGLASKSALSAANALADVCANEERGGEVMLAVQTERLNILASLLEIAASSEIDARIMDELGLHVRRILENHDFPPLDSLRHPELPPLHRPLLRILDSLFTRLAAPPRSIIAETLVEVGGDIVISAADIILDATQRNSAFTPDLALAVSAICEMIKIDTTVWLDKLAESNLIIRSLELINRTRLRDNAVPPYIHSILLIHLALANHPRAAEKLAISGLLPAYSDNAIATEAEYARIASSTDSSPLSVHSAWCSMLLVVRTVLSTLISSASFAKSDVIPFVRLTTAQLVQTLSWDADAALPVALLDEVSITAELFCALSSSIGANINLLSDFSGPALSFLRSFRYALNHPHLFSSHVSASSPDEQSALQNELATIDAQQDVILVDFAQTPILASRVSGIVKAARSVLLALASLSGALDVMTGQREANPRLIIYSDEDVSSASADPVGLFNDLQSMMGSLCEQVSTATDAGTELLRIGNQVSETAALLSASQILLRRAVLSRSQNDFDRDGDRERERDNDQSMEFDEKPLRRAVPGTSPSASEKLGGKSRNSGGVDVGGQYLREVEEDWRGLLEAESGAGERRFMRWLEEGLDRAFADEAGE